MSNNNLAKIKKEADDLGVKYDNGDGYNKVKEKVDAFKAANSTEKEPEVDEVIEPEVTEEPEKDQTDEDEQPDNKADEFPTFKNIGLNPHLVDGVRVGLGESVTLTEAQLRNVKLMAKIANAVKCNALQEV